MHSMQVSKPKKKKKPPRALNMYQATLKDTAESISDKVVFNDSIMDTQAAIDERNAEEFRQKVMSRAMAPTRKERPGEVYRPTGKKKHKHHHSHH